MVVSEIDFQNTPFGKLSYSLRGDDSGPTFFSINSTSGRISVKTDLRTDSSTMYTVLLTWNAYLQLGYFSLIRVYITIYSESTIAIYAID